PLPTAADTGFRARPRAADGRRRKRRGVPRAHAGRARAKRPGPGNHRVLSAPARHDKRRMDPRGSAGDRGAYRRARYRGRPRAGARARARSGIRFFSARARTVKAFPRAFGARKRRGASGNEALSALALGTWDSIVRDVAGHDYDKAQRIAGWPVVEVLHAHVAAIRAHAAESYRHRMLVWATTVAIAKDKKPPPVPAVLTDDE